MSCKNCNTELSGNFCATCGQKAKTHRIDGAFVSRELQRAFLLRDEGIYFTIRELFTRPGHTIREYLEGKRINHYKPFYLLASLSAIHFLTRNYFKTNTLDVLEMDESGKLLIGFLLKNYSITNLFIIPLISVASYIVYIKREYNFAEHFIINTFLSLQRIIIGTILIPFFYLIHKMTNIRFDHFKNIILFISFLFMLWSYKQLFFEKNSLKILLITLTIVIISFIILLIFIVFTLILIDLFINS